jgi:hypothetical protein
MLVTISALTSVSIEFEQAQHKSSVAGCQPPPWEETNKQHGMSCAVHKMPQQLLRTSPRSLSLPTEHPATQSQRIPDNWGSLR